MLTATTGFDTAVTGPEDLPEFRISLNLPGGIYPDVSLAADHVKIDAATTTDVPEGTRLDVGYPQMTAEFTLSGLVDPTDETKTAAWLFGRYSTTSPLYLSDVFRTPVTIDVGVYPDNSLGVPELVRKFTGYVDEYTASTDGSVTFTCIDKRSDLRALPAIPQAYTAGSADVVLTSEYVVDAVLRGATNQVVSSWPKRRPSCILAAGMRGSQSAEVGTVSSVGGSGFATITKPGAFGTSIGGRVGYTMTAALGTSFFLEQWLSVDLSVTPTILLGPTGLNSGNAIMTLTFGATSLQVQASSLTYTFTGITWTGSPQYVSLAVTWVSSTWVGVLRVDGATFSSGSQGIVGGVGTNNVQVQYNLYNSTVEALQITNESAPVTNYGYTPTAFLDPSLNNLDYVPPIPAGTDAWQMLQQIADAELAVLGFDESGTFRMRNRDTISGQASVRAITSASSLKALGVKSSAASVVNRASIGYTSYKFGGTATQVYSAGSAIKVPGHATLNLPVTLSSSAFNVSLVGYRFSTNQAGAAEAFPTRLYATQTGPDTATITIVNNGPTIWAVSPANYLDVPVGTPYLILNGQTITPNAETVADYQYPPAVNGGAASTRFGEVPYPSSGNQWIQNADSAMQLAQDIVVGACVPRPDLTGVDIVPDPRLQLTDRVHLQDPDVTSLDEYGVIFGWTITYDAGAYGMTIDVRTDAAPGGWLLGIAGRSEIGTGSSTTGATAYVYSGV